MVLWQKCLSYSCELRNVYVDEIRKTEHGFIWITIDNTRYYSCYISPNITCAEFENWLGKLERSFRTTTGYVVIAGDFNAKNTEWGSTINDEKGESLSDFIHSQGLAVCNQRGKPTWQRNDSEFHIDVTMVSANLATRIIGWEVLNEESHSDHNYIEFTIQDIQRHVKKSKHIKRRNTRNIDQKHLTRAIMACTSNTNTDRTTTNKLRSTYQRASRRREDSLQTEQLRTDYRNKRKDMTKAIHNAQARSWAELCRAVETDPWGIPYKVVTKRLGRSHAGSEARGREILIADTLFPTHPRINWESIQEQEQGFERDITMAELQLACRKLPTGKATGPDCIPNKMLAVLAKQKLDTLLDTFNACVRQCIFPER